MTAPLYKRLGIEWKHGAVGGETCERWVRMSHDRCCITETGLNALRKQVGNIDD